MLAAPELAASRIRFALETKKSSPTICRRWASMMCMSRRLVSKEEMAYEGDETHVSMSVMPSFLRKKVSEGKGKKQD